MSVKPVKIVVFWNLAGTSLVISVIADKADLIIATKNDETGSKSVTALRAHANYRGQRVFQYWSGFSISDVDAIADLPLGTAEAVSAQRNNNVGWRSRVSGTPGVQDNSNGHSDVYNIRESLLGLHNSMFIRVVGGPDNGKTIVATTGRLQVAIDHTLDYWYDFFTARVDLWTWATATLNAVHYDGFILDNGDIQLDWNQPGGAAVATHIGSGTDEPSRQSMRDYYDRLRPYAHSRTGHLGYPGEFGVNVQGWYRGATELIQWKSMHVRSNFSKRLDWGMMEFFAVSSGGDYQTQAIWQRNIDALEYASGHGVGMMCVINGVDDADAEANPTGANGLKARFGILSAKLAGGPNTYIRVTNGYGGYTHLTLCDTLQGLGAKIGRYYLVSGTQYRADFQGGYILVDNTAQTSSYVITGIAGTAMPDIASQEGLVRASARGNVIDLYIPVEAAVGGALSVTPTNLPDGLSAAITGNATSGCFIHITGTISGTAALINNYTLTLSESGGTTNSTSGLWYVQPGTRINGIDSGGVAVTNSYNDTNYVFVQDNGSVDATLATDLTLTANGSTVSNTSTAPNMSNMLPWWDNGTTLKYYRQKGGTALSTGPVYNWANLTAGNYTIIVGLNSRTDTTGTRVIKFKTQGNDATCYWWEANGTPHNSVNIDPYVVVGSTTDKAGFVVIPVTVSGTTLTLEMQKVSGSNAVEFGAELWRDFANTAPTLAAISSQTMSNPGTRNVAVSASDPDTGQTLVFSLGTISPSLPVGWSAVMQDNGNGTGYVNIIAAGASARTYTIPVIVSDGVATDTKSFTLTVNSQPTIGALAAFSMIAGNTTSKSLVVTSLSQTPARSDEFPMVIRSYDGFNTAWVNRLVSVSQVDDYNYTLDFSPDLDQYGVQNLYATFTDEDGNQATMDFTVTVDQNQNPVVTPIAPQIITEGDTFSIGITATDADGTIASFSVLIAPTLPSNPTINLTGTGGNRTLSFDTTSGDAGIYTIAITATDNVGNTGSTNLTLTVSAPPSDIDPKVFYSPRARHRARVG